MRAMSRLSSALVPVLLLAAALAAPAGAHPSHTHTATAFAPGEEHEPGVYLEGAEAWIASDCTDNIPIVVASDAKAQSDIYSAITLAGAAYTDCVVLAGPRDGPMSAEQKARLAAALPSGYVVGGVGAVPEAKLAGSAMTRVAGADRWATAHLVGSEARRFAGDTPAGAPTDDGSLVLPSDAHAPGVFLEGAEPWVASDCAGDVPIVVASDARAQSDIYSAVTLAGVIGTDCIVLAGPRDGPMPGSQQARLSNAAPGGCLLGGDSALPPEKFGEREGQMTWVAGQTRWKTAEYVGYVARERESCVRYVGNPGETYRSVIQWWEQPRGEMLVKVFVCAQRGFEHLFDDELMKEFVDILNEEVAPFYAWQSSNTFSVRFEFADTVSSRILERPFILRGSHGVLVPPSDCRREPAQPTHLAHHYLVYGHDIQSTDGGGSCSNFGATKLPFASNNPVRQGLLSDRTRFVVWHELDHHICVPHLNGTLRGVTRTGGAEIKLTGSLRGIPPSRVSSGSDLPLVYTCYDIERKGWPIGNGAPACAHIPHLRPFGDEISANYDGTLRLSWEPLVNPINTEPIAGYVIELLDDDLREQDSPEALIETFRVPGDVTEFSLPQSTLSALKSGNTYRLRVAADSVGGIGRFTSGRKFLIQNNNLPITVTQSSTPTWSIIDVSWEPNLDAEYYLISGFKNCSATSGSDPSVNSRCSIRTIHPSESSIVLRETDGIVSAYAENAAFYVVDGSLTSPNHIQSITQILDAHIVEAQGAFDITVFACGPRLVEHDVVAVPAAPPDCVMYGTAQIVAESGTAPPLAPIRLEPVPGCRLYDQDMSRVVGTCHQAQWEIQSGSSDYLLAAWSCTEDGQLPPCAERPPRERTNWAVSDYAIDGSTVTAKVWVGIDNQGWIQLEAYFDCAPSGRYYDCWRNLYAQSRVTLPDSAN